MDKYSWDNYGVYLNSNGNYYWHKDVYDFLDKIKELASKQEYNKIIEICNKTLGLGEEE